MLTPRENLLRLLKKQGYEWIPVEFELCDSLEKQFHYEHGENVDYRDYYNIPWRKMPKLIPDNPDRECFLSFHAPEDGIIIDNLDEWGVGRKTTKDSMHITKMYSPLRHANELDELENYPFPTFSTKKNPDVAAQVKALHDRGLAAVADVQCTVWENSWYIRGMEPLMMDLLCDYDMAAYVLDKVTNAAIQRAKLYVQAGVDILYVGDDVGTQRALMMSEKTYVEWLKPRIKLVIDAARSINKDVIVCYHSCGYIEPLIPHLIDVGIDVLNPIQPECMDFKSIYDKYNDKISFHGTIGTQTTMPFGTPQEVKDLVKYNLDIASKKGGLLVTPTHVLEPEVPWQNIEAYVEACREYTAGR